MVEPGTPAGTENRHRLEHRQDGEPMQPGTPARTDGEPAQPATPARTATAKIGKNDYYFIFCAFLQNYNLIR